MRLIGTFNDPHRGQKFSLFLNNKGIRNQLDVHPNQDWGSEEYGTVHCDLWVLEEEEYFEALRWYEEFQEHPFDPMFNVKVPVIPLHLRLSDSDGDAPSEPEEEPVSYDQPPKRVLGMATTIILGLCIALFVLSGLMQPPMPNFTVQLPPTPFVTPTIKKELLFDYPKAYAYIDQAIDKFGEEAAADPSQLPPAGKALINTALTTPYWKGIYPDLVLHARSPSAPWTVSGAPLFEKIREGQIWRLISPIFLHADIFHILFNMVWLIALGPQMEKILGIGRYLFFIVLVGILANTAQYLVSGFNFLGYSGVICGMIGFIWKRQKMAPWEGYQLQNSTILFVTAYVLFILGIQILAFFVEVASSGGGGPKVGLANTAHITGAAVGYFLGKCKFFGWRE